ncbi:MAG: B12-binding domain-containing protein [Spirochaetes bacterium]|nr:B12-binding domain-containing protein [Spirochaetota bacterium]
MEQETEDRILRVERALLSLDTDEARKLLQEPSGRTLPHAEAEAMIVPALERIGLAWEEGRIALSQVYMSGRQCEEFMDALQLGAAATARGSPNLAIAVLEDYHLLGLRRSESAGGWKAVHAVRWPDLESHREHGHRDDGFRLPRS